jgi:C1q domain
MKNFTILILTTFSLSTTYGQIGISSDGSAPHSSAALDIKSTSKAFYPPRMSTTDKNNIVGKQAGAMVFDNTLNQLSFYNGSSWAGAGFIVPYSAVINSTNNLLNLENTNTSINVSTVLGVTNSSTIAAGIIGTAANTAPTNNTAGLRGINKASNGFGYGVQGVHEGAGIGGYFSSTSGKSLITGTGNVGIGVSDPFTILDIKSRIRIRHGAETAGIYFDGSTDTFKGFIGMRNDNHIGLYGFNGAGWAFNMNASNGFVGIGNDAPEEKLHITAGNIRVESLANNGSYPVYANQQGNLQTQAPVAFLARCGGPNNLPISTTSNYTAPFNYTDYNLGNFFNNTNNQFVVPVNGIYHFDALVTVGAVIGAPTNADLNITYYIDETNMDTFKTQPMINTSEWTSLTLSQDIKLNIGQTVKVKIYQTSGSDVLLITGPYQSFFSGHLVMRL